MIPFNIRSLIPALALVLIFFPGCEQDSNPVGELQNTLDKIPNFTLIPGAESVNIKVTQNENRSYFDIDIRNIGEISELRNGTYNGWCVVKDSPIQSDGTEYRGVTMYSTLDDPSWNRYNYLLNMRRNYIRGIEGASWKEIQMAIWTLMETSDKKVASLDRSPISGYNESITQYIVDDVIAKGDSFRYEPGYVYAAFMDNNTNLYKTECCLPKHQNTISECYNKFWYWKKFSYKTPFVHHFYGPGNVYMGHMNIWWGPKMYISIYPYNNYRLWKDEEGESRHEGEGKWLLEKAKLYVGTDTPPENTDDFPFIKEFSDYENGYEYTFEIPIDTGWDETTELNIAIEADLFKEYQP